MSTDNLLAELTSKTGLTETELNRQALIIGLMALCHPDAIAGDLVSAALTGSYSDSTDKLLTRGDNASDSVLMSMRILLHRLSKYERSDGKVGQINKMMHRLGYFKASDVLREAQ